MLRYALIVGLLLSIPAAAQEVPDGLALKIADQAQACLALLPSERKAENFVILDVDVAADGTVDRMPAVVKAPRGEAGVSRSIQRSVMACGPYKFKDTPFAGVVRITITPKS